MQKLLQGFVAGALIVGLLFAHGLGQLKNHQPTLSASPAMSVSPTNPAPTAPYLATPSGPAPELVELGAPTFPTPVQPAPPLWHPQVGPSTWAMAAAIEQAVRTGMKDFPGQYSVIVHDLTTAERWTLNADDFYHPASTIKLPVALYALNKHMAGELSWQQMIQYTEADFESPGGGLFETSPFGGYWPVENLVNRALMYSNNVAVNMLGRYLGWNNIRAFTRSIDGELYRLSDGTPQVSANSELGWWLYLHHLSSQHPTKAELLVRPLQEVGYHGRIGAGLPSGVSYLHKFGSYEGYNHDSGIVYAERP